MLPAFHLMDEHTAVRPPGRSEAIKKNLPVLSVEVSFDSHGIDRAVQILNVGFAKFLTNLVVQSIFF